MADIYIQRVNASFIKVLTDDDGIREDLYHAFRYEEPGFVKNKWTKWDGVVRLYNKQNAKMAYGLLEIILKLAGDRGYSVELDPRFNEDITPITKEQIVEWTNEYNLTSGGRKIEVYDYQIDALYLAIRYNRMTLLAATSAGKSLIIYLLCRYYESLHQDDGLKTLIIVPSIMLVNQMYDDFKDYSTENGWNVDLNVHTIFEGSRKDANKMVYVSTWQSIKDQDKDYFHQFGRIIVDEAHGAKAACVKTICENGINAYQRIGLTGTLDNTELHPLMVQGNFGPIRRVVTTKQLQDAGRASDTLVTMMMLDYPVEQRAVVRELNYEGEIEWLINHEYRNKVIKSLAKTLKGNSLLLFARVDAHLMKIYEELVTEETGNKQYFVISGDVDGDEREDIKKAAENGSDIVILATYGTMSTGVSIKKLHNLVFCHPTKSVIRVLQSLGRLIRLHDSKDIASIFDLVDNLQYQGRQNKSLEHGLLRYTYYQKEQHKMKQHTVRIPGTTMRLV